MLDYFFKGLLLIQQCYYMLGTLLCNAMRDAENRDKNRHIIAM